MEQIVNQVTTVSIGLGLLGASWLTNFLTGVSKYIFNDKKWSWKIFFESLVKALLMSLATIAWVGVTNFLTWFAGKCGADITSIMDGVSVAGICAGVIGGSAFFLVKAYKNIINFVNESHVEVVATDVNYKEIAETIKNGIETILGKTVKEQLEEEGIDTSAIDGEIIDAGKGGIVDTYPEPYRSAKQDSILDPSTCWNRECCSYTAWKIAELKGSWMSRTGSMNAKEWIYRLPEHGYKEVTSPREGGFYLGVSQLGKYGHIVKWEHDNIISEYNYVTKGGFSTRSIDLSTMRWFEIQAPKNDPTPTPEPKPIKTDIKVGDWVVPTKLVDYNGTALKQYDKKYEVLQLAGDRAVLAADRNGRKIVWAAMPLKSIKKA